MYVKESVIWKKRENGSMLYDTKNENSMSLNDTGTLAFLAKYVNHFAPEDIAFNLYSKFPEQKYEDILNDVVSVLNYIDSSDFVTQDSDRRGYINLLEPEQQLDNIILEVTRSCNLECTHCIESGSSKITELSTKEMFDLLEELHMLKVYRIVLTGGEPLVRNDLIEIVKKCTEKKIRTIIFTNGTLISEDFLSQVKDLNVLIRFSIDGADADTHDKIRGKGNFEKTITAMKLCRQFGLDIGTATTVTSLNFDQYFKILELSKGLGSKEIELSEVLPKGNASLNKDLLLNQDQLEQLRVYNLMVSNKEESFRRGMGFDRMNQFPIKLNHQRKYSCNAGISTCFISADGSVYPCTLFKEYPEFKCGNITEKSFLDIWNNSSVLKEIRGLEITQIKTCVDCECFKTCPGGCRARAYAETHKLDGPMIEEFCTISKNMHKRLEDGEFNNIWGPEATNAILELYK